MAIRVVQDQPQFRRTMRRPTHTFNLRTVPYVVQPFMLAPVLPGETLKNLLLQARVVSDPIKNPLIGWWNEYYLFYVKHRDLSDRDDLSNMMVDPTWTPATIKSETINRSMYFDGQVGEDWVNWTDKCLDRVVEEYFRDEGEVTSDHTFTFASGNMPIAANDRKSWLDSVTPASEYDPQSVDFNVDLDASTTVEASEVAKSLAMWEHLRHAGLTQQTYEEYLATYGVDSPEQVEEPHKPELIRFMRDYSYPSNTIDPTDGSAASALSWSVAERADKDRFFAEPGFIFGVTVKRPKVYLSGQVMSAAAMMNGVMEWLPMTMMRAGLNSHAGMKEITALKGPLESSTENYWVDINDLLQYGDQFLNFDVSASNAGTVALPTAAMEKRYPTLTDVQNLFIDDTGAGFAFYVREDGIVSLQIAGHFRDQTPTT